MGLARPDDAGVYLLRDDLALVQTVDVITPISDDPFDFGRITAANAMSDVWAMGGRPVTALSIVAFPVGDEPPATFRRMLEGALDRFAAADCALVGGHSISDPELKLGFAITGVADPRRILTKGGARPGDVLVLTKPLGTGVISTALRLGEATELVASAAIESMARLNREASEAALEAGVVACTDVTGFGLGGHLSEMVSASGVGVVLHTGALPLLTGARELADRGLSPGGTGRNLDFAGPRCDGLDDLDDAIRALLFDPQTSGGLLMAVPPAALDRLRARLAADGVTCAVVGAFTDAVPAPRILLLP